MAGKLKTGKKRARGVVKSDKMAKTVTIVVERLVQDPRYGKYVRRKSTFMAHNPHDHARQGDLVEIESTRPLSRRKRWRVVRVLKRAMVLPARLAGEPSTEPQPSESEQTA